MNPIQLKPPIPFPWSSPFAKRTVFAQGGNLCLFAVLILFSSLFAAASSAQSWKILKSGTDAGLRGISITERRGLSCEPFCPPIVWVSGSKGTILRSLDQGKTWQDIRPAGHGDPQRKETADLDFRGIVAFDERTAYAMSSGEGDKSRIYKTSDGGSTWKLQLTGDRKEFFLDSIACTSPEHCIALGDPIEGKFTLLRTTDGETWRSLPAENLPTALPEEGAFAASNSCLLLRSETEFYFVTGGPKARVLHATNSGKSWDITEPPIAHGSASSGIFSIAADFEQNRIVVVGGDYKEPSRVKSVAALSEDGGRTWRPWRVPPGGFRSAVVARGLTILAVGTNGSDFSDDGGKNWQVAKDISLNAAVWYSASIWAVGPNGTIAYLPPRLALQ